MPFLNIVSPGGEREHECRVPKLYVKKWFASKPQLAYGVNTSWLCEECSMVWKVVAYTAGPRWERKGRLGMPKVGPKSAGAGSSPRRGVRVANIGKTDPGPSATADFTYGTIK